MEVKQGYKKTDIGIIPCDWEVKSMSEIGDSIIGLTYSPSNVKPFGTLVLRSSNVQNGKLAFEDNVYVEMDLPNRVIVKESDILICVRNGSKQLIGKCALIDKKTEGSAFGAFMSIYRTKLSKYVFHQFQSFVIQRQIDETLGATINQLTNKDLAVFQIPLPPTLTEQTAIATALSDADSYIASLEKLIAKKRLIKQGAMQELLKPKEGWVVKKLGEIGIFKGGNGFPLKIQGNKEGEYPFFKVSDMNNEGNSSFMVNCNNWLSELTKKENSISTFPPNTIVFAKIGAAIFLERKKILVRNSCIDNNMMGFIIDEEKYDFRYIHYLFLTISLGALVSTTALPSLSGKEIGSLEFSFPKKEEQSRIANILSDMDTEIEQLEKQLSKAQSIKQGMMQQLLTGKIRLV